MHRLMFLPRAKSKLSEVRDLEHTQDSSRTIEGDPCYHE